MNTAAATQIKKTVAQPRVAASPALELAFVNTPFNYTGSKFKLLGQIIPLFDYSKPYFVDLFAGGGSVYTNVVEHYERVVMNDVIGDLVGIHRGLIRNKDQFAATVRALCVAKDDQVGYHTLRDSYNAVKTPEKLFALMLCCTNNMMRFNLSGGFNQTFGKRTFNDSTAAKIEAWVAHLLPRVDKISFLNRSFLNVQPQDVKNTFFYIDPPYYGTHAGYSAGWKKEDEAALYDYVKRLDAGGGSFAVSGVLGEHVEGREESSLISRLVADKYSVTLLKHDYEKVARVKEIKTSREVLIRNF